MKVFVFQNMIVMGRLSRDTRTLARTSLIVIVMKRMQGNIENEVINENKGIRRGNYMNENRSWQNNAVSNYSITKKLFH
jgi:hypothetical protein